MTTFVTKYNLDDLDLAYKFCLPCFIIECDLEIDYKIILDNGLGFGRNTENIIEYESINVLSILTEKGIFIPADKQVGIILFHLKDIILDEKVWDNEICLQAEREQEKAEWLYETKIDRFS